MTLVEITLNNFVYRFRPLNWVEQTRLKFPQGEDQRMVVMANALVDVSGMKISSVTDARKVLQHVPNPLRWRIWVLYKGGLPSDRFFTTRGLYEALENLVHQKKLLAEGDFPEAEGEKDPLLHKSSAEEVAEARELEQRLAGDALKQRAARATAVAHV